MPCHFSLSEASIERLRKFLLPLELAEAELRAKPAAAVMILLREGGQGLEVLLGERRKREGDPWSGQVGLPGGRHHEEDGTLLSTAIRETREEVGIDLNGCAEVLGHMAPRAPGNKPELLVVPFVAIATVPLEASPGPEMTSVFWTPLTALPATQGKTLVPTILGELYVPSYTFGEWLIWAAQQADRIDPLKVSTTSIIDSKAPPSPHPSYYGYQQPDPPIRFPKPLWA